MFYNRLLSASVAALSLSLVSSASNAAVIFSDDFSGAGAALNGIAPDVGPAGVNWSANSPFRDNGTLNGTEEGSALLAFEPAVNSQYVLQLDVSNTTDRWIALGFARDALQTPGANNINDRLSNESEGISWMLFRNTATANQDVQVFGGLRTAPTLYSGDPVANFGVPHTIRIEIDTTGTGANFKAQFFVDNVALLATPATININIADINFAGISYDNSTATPPTFDNFSLTQVPEPASLGALGLAATALVRRRRA